MERGRETSTALAKKERNLFYLTALVPSEHDASLQACIGEQYLHHGPVVGTGDIIGRYFT